MSNPNLPKFTSEQSAQYRSAALAVRHAQKTALDAFVKGDIDLNALREQAGGIKVSRVLTALTKQVRYFGPTKLVKLARSLDVNFFERRLTGVGDQQFGRLKELTDQLRALQNA